MTLDNKTKQLLRDPAKRRYWVIYQLGLLGLSLAKVAKGHGVRRQTLNAALHKTYPRMEKVLADALEVAPKDLFPERYDADGLPLYRYGRPKKSTDKDTEKRAGRNIDSTAVNRQRASS